MPNATSLINDDFDPFRQFKEFELEHDLNELSSTQGLSLDTDDIKEFILTLGAGYIIKKGVMRLFTKARSLVAADMTREALRELEQSSGTDQVETIAFDLATVFTAWHAHYIKGLQGVAFAGYTPLALTVWDWFSTNEGFWESAEKQFKKDTEKHVLPTISLWMRGFLYSCHVPLWRVKNLKLKEFSKMYTPKNLQKWGQIEVGESHPLGSHSIAHALNQESTVTINYLKKRYRRHENIIGYEQLKAISNFKDKCPGLFFSRDT